MAFDVRLMKFPRIAILLIAVAATALGDEKSGTISKLKAFDGDESKLPDFYTVVRFETYEVTEEGISNSYMALRERLAETGEKSGISLVISGGDVEAKISVELKDASLADVFDQIALKAGYRWTIPPEMPKPVFYRDKS